MDRRRREHHALVPGPVTGRWSYRSGLAVLIAPFVLAAVSRAAQPDGQELFESRIRPLLVDRCYACHNAANAAEGGLALDSRDGLLAGGDSGPAIVPGDPAASLLVRVLRHEVEGLKMPKDSGRLSAEAIADVERWIAAGAVDPRDAPPSRAELEAETSWDAVRGRRLAWWSFQPLAAPAIPPGGEGPFGSHDVDRFLAARWREAGVEPAAEAPAEVLVRRLFFALTGLPPAPAESAGWTARLATPGGFESLVDHLLASPHFGERWARHWMDWIRYADTHGSEGDPEIVNTHLYRDALVRALNADVPLDRLIREHVAGDLVPDPRLDPSGTIDDSALLTAHWRMVFHGYSPTDPLEEKTRFVDDQIAAFTKAFLGLTVSCARCHDHKFDPISQRDYYALAGVIASSRPGRREAGPPASAQVNRAEILDLAPPLRRALADRWQASLGDLTNRIASFDPLVVAATEPRLLLHPLHRAGADGTDTAAFRAALPATPSAGAAPEPIVRWDMAIEADRRAWTGVGSGLVDMAATPVAGRFDVAVEGERAIDRVLPRAVVTQAISSKHGGRACSPVIGVVGAQELWVLAAGGGGATVRYVVEDYPRGGPVYPIAGLTPEWKWHRFDLTYWDGDRIHVELATARDAVLPAPNAAERSWFALREVRVVPRGGPAPLPPDEPRATVAARAGATDPAGYRTALVAALGEALAAWGDGRATDRDALLIDAALAQGLLENRLAHLGEAAGLVAERRRLEAVVPSQPRVPAPEETAGLDHPLYRRGDHRTPEQAVARGFPALFGATTPVAAGSGRRELADDLLAPGNPLPRRVLANRIWHHLWGRGIAATPDNVGHLGQPPTHPDLLDHLAVRLGHDGWSLKGLVRHVVTARAWRLDSAAPTTNVALDPDNRLWARGTVRRLEAEPIRDALLACAGTLDRALHGPPADGGSPRRSLYVRVARNAIDPLLRVFDFPEPASATGARDVTNVPAQALALLNDPQVVGLAEAFAARVIAATPGATADDRLDAMIREALGRASRPAERDELRRLLAAAQDDVTVRRQRVAALDSRAAAARDALESLLADTRARVAGALPTAAAPAALFAWDFATGVDAVSGGPAGTPHGGAVVRDGALVVAGGGYVTTAPLPRSIRARTLAALVRLDSLEQQGGGVMAIQSADGAVFDAIVFAEQQPGEWLAGSNVFARTRPFGGPRETEAHSRPVHVAICWDDDGTVRGYRDGVPYGAPYRTSAPVEFPAGTTVVSFGLRHLPAGGNRLLSGRVIRATLHDRALPAEEVAALAAAAGSQSREALIAALPSAEADRARALVAEIEEAAAARRSVVPVPVEHEERLVWAEVARALFLSKEFIYLR